MRIIIFISCLFCCIYASSQTYEIKKGISEIYRIENYGENDFTVVYNVNNPFNLADYNALWREKVKIFSYKIDAKDFVVRYILPAVQNSALDRDLLLLRIYISLDGKLRFVEYGFPSSLEISIETIEEMEQAMKNESFFVLKFDPDKMNDTPYIMITSTYYLGVMLKHWKPSKPFIPLKPDFDSELVD